VVQALDLGIMVPLAIVTAVLVWRRRALGYLLATVLVIEELAMAAAISAMVALAGHVEGQLEMGYLVIFLVIAVVCGALIRAMFGAITEDARLSVSTTREPRSETALASA
jgi:hypothetical protein